MADQFIQVPTDAGGKKVDTSELTVNAQTVERQRIVLADPTDAAGFAKIQSSDPALTDYGTTVRIAKVGSSLFHLVSAASTNGTNVKASAGRVTGWYIFNNAGYPVYVKFHNTAGTPTAGSGVVYTIGIQAGTSVQFSPEDGLAFATGIGLTITKLMADADTTVVAASDCVVNVHYK